MSARGWIGVVGLAALAVLSVPMAAAGPEIAPGSGRGGDPGWLAGLYGDGFGLDGSSYLQLERAALVAYAVVIASASAMPRRLLGGAVVALVGLFALAPPLLSLDVFSYVSYARLEGLYGLNPYEFAPASVPGDEAVAFVDYWRDQVSVYGPLFTIATTPLAHVGVGGAVWALKAVAALSVLGIAAVVWRLAGRRGVDSGAAAALVALNPLVLVHVVGGAHNDALMVALMTVAVSLVAAGRELSGGAGLVAAAGVKASALIVAPFALLGSGRRTQLAAGFGLGLLLVVGIGLVAYGSPLLDAVAVVGESQGTATRESVPATASRVLDVDLDAVRPVCLGLGGLAIAALLAWTARGADWIRAAGWGALALLAATSYLTPWYAIWALPLAAVSRDRVMIAATVLFTAFLLRHQQLGLGG